ncbi:MAG: molybdopterin cofactor-binding domain-containing protein [Planctomycetota bacterium]
MSPELSRRSLLRGLVAGGGLVFAARLGTDRLWAQSAAEPTDWSPDIFVTIHPSGQITIVTHRSEMGTGVRSTLPMVLADELDADWSRVTLEQATGNPTYGDQNTDGSRSIVQFYQAMRRIGATARFQLERAAAEIWGVEQDQVRVSEHGVVGPGGKRLEYAELVEKARTYDKPRKSKLVYKTPEEWRYVGRETKTYDLDSLVTGRGIFGADVRVPGMLYAVIARPPVVGAAVKSVDDSVTRKIAGVVDVHTVAALSFPVVFQPLGGVAVLATSTWAAMQGRDALKIEWDLEPAGKNAQYDSAAYAEALHSSVSSPGKKVVDEGDIEATLAGAVRTFTADYYLPHLSHAPMEPPVALAIASENACEVWTCTQNPQAARDQVASALGLEPDQVTCHVTLLGGGFGRKSKPDYCAEAALLSRHTGKPVRVQWTREDDIRHDYYHSVCATHLEAAVDEANVMVGWLGRSACPTIMSTFQANQDRPTMEMSGGQGFHPPFAISNRRIEACEAPAHVRIGWLRSVANVFHAFSVCSFADEIAQGTGQDPVEFLTRSVNNPEHRLVKVAQLCAEQAGWGRQLPKGQAQGFAMHASFGSYVAVIATVELSKTGEISLRPKCTSRLRPGCGQPRPHPGADGRLGGARHRYILRWGSITAKDGAIVAA